jgi:hypothetical protein
VPASTSSSSEEERKVGATNEEEKASAAWEQWRQQQREEEAEEAASAAKEEEKRIASLAPVYERLFRNPRGRIFDQPARFLMNEEEKKVYRQGLVEGSGGHVPSEISNLIYQYTVPIEFGTPVQFCYEKTLGGNSVESKPACIENIDRFRLSIYAAERANRRVPFKENECAIYCLFKNLPISVLVMRKIGSSSNYLGYKDSWIPFSITLSIDVKETENDNDKFKKLLVDIKFDEAKQDYDISLSGISNNQIDGQNYPTIQISMDDVIDLIFHYGPISNIDLYFSGDQFYPLSDEAVNYKYTPLTKYNYWNPLKNEKSGFIFRTFGKR